MNVLHLSDLHITPESEYKDLNSLWSPVQTALGEKRFDFIVISGDLTYKGYSEEYNELLRFIKNTLLKLLVFPQERRRIILVPGNHDVNWRYLEKSTKVLPKDKSWNNFAKEAQFKPVTSNYRIELTANADIQVRKIVNESRYVNRFKNIQNFFYKFYTDIDNDLEKNFDLLSSEDDGNDWSLHYFHEDKVAFFGFNSCHRNDNYWRGSSLNPKSILNAQEISNKLNNDVLKIAVWHHGLSSEQGNSDYLPISSIAGFKNIGCNLGFHGHTHESGSKIVDFYRGSFTSLGTGTLAAGHNYLKTGTPNQFSIYEIYQTRVYTTVYGKNNNGQYVPKRDRKGIFYINKQKDYVKTYDFIHIKKQQRNWKVFPDGVSKIDVIFNDVTVYNEGAFPIAIISNIPSNIDKNIEFYADSQLHELKLFNDELATKAKRIVCTDLRKGHYKKCICTYYISNRVAQDKSELESMGTRNSYFSEKNYKEVVGHTAKLFCDELEINIEFMYENPFLNATSSEINNVNEVPNVRVDELIIDHEHVEWVSNREEIKRTKDQLTITDNKKIQLRIDSPIIDCRYAIEFTPEKKGKALDSVSIELLDSVIRNCRRVDLNPSSQGMDNLFLIKSLRDYFENSLLNYYINDDENTEPHLSHKKTSARGLCGIWSCRLWSKNNKLLMPVFGNCSMKDWNKLYHFGEGMPGHCFRYRDITAWHRDEISDYVNSIIRTDDLKYNFIISVPLFFKQGEASVGVITFAGFKSKRQYGLYGIFSELSRKITSLMSSHNTDDNISSWNSMFEESDALLQAVNFIFWSSIDRYFKDEFISERNKINLIQDGLTEFAFD